MRIFGALAAFAAAALAVLPAAADPYWGGHRRHGGDWEGAAAAGLIGGLALGALAGATAARAPYDAYECAPAEEPVFDEWGEVIAYRRVDVCR